MNWSANIKQLLPGRHESIPPLIVGSLEMEGDFFFTASGCVDSRIKGTFSSNYHLELGANAEITGPVAARSLVIQGTVLGNVKTEREFLGKKEAKVLGNIRARSFRAEPGFQFEGGLDIGPA